MNEKETYSTHVDKRLIIRQRIFTVIITVLIVISTLNVLHGKITALLAIAGFLLATLIGIGLSRMFNIFWHPEKEKVISKLDTLGGILLAAYIAIEAGRTWVFEHWLSGAALNAFGLIILGGLLLGRYIGTRSKIKKVLTENNKLPQ